MDFSLIVGVDGASANIELISHANAKKQYKMLLEDAQGEKTTKLFAADIMKNAEPAIKAYNSILDVKISMGDLSKNGHLVQFIAEKERDEKLCCSVVKQDPYIISHLSTAEKTPAVCRSAVTAFGQSIYFIEPEIRTEDLRVRAMKKNGLSIRHFDDNERTPPVCEAAAHHTGISMRYMNDDQKTARVCRLGVAQNGLALEYAPEAEKTLKLCETALEGNIYAAKHMKRENYSLDAAKMVQDQLPKTKKYESIHNLVDDICEKAAIAEQARVAQKFIISVTTKKSKAQLAAH